MRRLLHIIIYIALMAMPAAAQRAQLHKLSPWLRHVVRTQPSKSKPLTSSTSEAAEPSANLKLQTSNFKVHAFVRLTPGSADALEAHGSQSLARFGDIYIASIPLDSLATLTADRRVLRIEASPRPQLHTDSMGTLLHAVPVYEGQGLPQAFTGEGVVMGVVDVGFDLTHPTFFSSGQDEAGSEPTGYRIRRFWDQISADTVGSTLPVGRDYITEDAILAVGHSRDATLLSHGTHTLGIAAGSGFGTPYRGMAPEADICLVANAVNNNLPLIDPDDVYKYTYATDALAFKYIFDYAESVGQPCVISFSEGSPQDFHGYDQLYYAILDSLTGPGRILVASAGNDGASINYIHKQRDTYRSGAFLRGNDTTMTVTLASPDEFWLRLTAYDGSPQRTVINPLQALEQADSTFTVATPHFTAIIEAYPSCYDAADMCYDLTITTPERVGRSTPLSLELMGNDADVQLWRVSGTLTYNDLNLDLSSGETTHMVHSPSSAPSVISVGATSYRNFIVNAQGDTMSYWTTELGLRVPYSSMGPTLDGRTKPDCVAPGNNIISSYSSYFMEANPTSGDLRWEVERFTVGGRTYGWTSNSGTSMSAPAVGGAVALWLQACPTLSPADVLSVLEHTCTHPEPALTYPNTEYGYGQVDVYAGLLHILDIDAISDVPRRHTAARIVLEGRCLTVTPPLTPHHSPLAILDLSGRTVFTTTISEGQENVSIPLPPLAAGVYVVTIGDTSTLIRLK